jgi:parvulin-like peptidyl-prolyl isomerase
MTITIIDRAVGRRPIRVTALSLALACCPMLASAQTPQPPRAAQAQAPAKPKAAPQAAAQPAAATAAVTQGTAAQGSAKAAGEDVVARVGNTNVSAEELRSYVAALAPNERAALAQDPALFSQAVRMLLANRLVLQEISAKKWDQQPNVIAQLDRVRENAVVELYLQTASAPPANYPSDEDLQKVYDANRAALLMPRQFELAQIFVALPKDADKAAEDQAKKSLDDLQRKLKAPAADFAALANENNAKNNTGNGGDLGWLLETQIRQEIRARVMELAKGAVSEPIRLDDGWHIIKLIDTKASYTRTLPEVRDQLVQQMRNERATALRRAYITELLREHPPVLNELALSNLLLEQTPAAR